MRDLVVLFIHFIAILARLLGPGGVRSVVAESLLLKHQLLILNRSRQRSPNLSASDRILAGWMALLMRPTRLLRSAIVLKPSTLLGLHQALSKRKYRMLFSPNRRRKPGPKGPSAELIHAVVEMKQRNPTWGCPRIAQQIALAFDIPIDKDVVRRILAHHYRPGRRRRWSVLADVPGPHERQPLEYGSVPMRVGHVADPLGPGRHGSIHAPDHWVRRPCRNGRWCRTLSDVQPRHSRATLDAEVPQLRPRSALSVPPVASQSADPGGDRNQDRPLRSPVPSLRGTANRHHSTRVFGSHVVLDDGRSRKQTARFQDLLQPPSHPYLTGRANAGYARVTTSRQSPLVSMATSLSRPYIRHPWLPEFSKLVCLLQYPRHRGQRLGLKSFGVGVLHRSALANLAVSRLSINSLATGPRVRHRFSGVSSLGTRPSRRYFRAVFASIPAFAAAVSRFVSTFPKANNLLTCLSVTKL